MTKGGDNMFGYLQPFKDELRMKDHQLYKSVYCGLCKSMKKKYPTPAHKPGWEERKACS